MTGAFAPGLQALEKSALSKLRELPIAGEILVKVGDRVASEQIVARAELPGELFIVRIPEKMGLLPPEVIAGLKVKVGQEVQEGQLVCEHRGFFGLLASRFFSPISGRVELITERTGHIAIRMASKRMELRAYLAGEVRAVTPQRAVLINSTGVFIQGIFGVGGERNGVLHLLDVAAEALIDERDIPADVTGAILVGGARATSAALKLAAARGAVGFVTGSIDDQTLADYLGYDLGIALTGDEDVPMTLIITEGFGHLPLSKRVLSILSKCPGRSVAINGATQVRAGALRPEILIPAESEAVMTPAKSESRGDPGAKLGVGCSVRLIRVPYFGQFGEVVELPDHPRKIETGAVTRVALVKLVTSNEVVAVPRANLEVV